MRARRPSTSRPAATSRSGRGRGSCVFLKSGGRELYNLQADLSETKDVLAANAEVVETLTALMRKYVADGRSTAGGAQKNDAAISVDGEKKGEREEGGEGSGGRDRPGARPGLRLTPAGKPRGRW